MANIGYDTIRDYAAVLAERIPLSIDPAAGLPDSEDELLALTFASELPDLWNREAWPELCDNLEQVSLTSFRFSKRIGDPTEMGDILGVYTADPRSASVGWSHLEYVEEGDYVRVLTESAAVFVDWQEPPTALDDLTSAQRTAKTLPARFRRTLALLGAAALLDAEDAPKAASYRRQAEIEMQKQASRIQPAWWRRPIARGV
jgi:hypothetical protein